MDLRKALGLETVTQAENTVCFEIFPDQGGASEEVAAECMRHLLPWVEDHVWQREAFRLRCSSSTPAPWHHSQSQPDRNRGSSSRLPDSCGSELEACLWGQLCFGDNIEDEWFVVWLLLKLSCHVPCAARVWDNDGDFLLIEAAYSLPKWATPRVTPGRVWLRNGQLHLLAPSLAEPSARPEPLRVGEALALLRDPAPRAPTAAPRQVWQPIQTVLEQQPRPRHAARLLVSPLARALLRAAPHLAGAGVEAFYYRDPDGVRAAMRWRRLRGRTLVPVRASLSRCLFAQLSLQQLQPPRDYPMPRKLAQEYHEADLGWKLTAGLEMALDAAASAPPPASAAAPAAGSGHCAGDLKAYLSKCVDLENPTQALLRVYAQIEQQPAGSLEAEAVPPGDAEDWLAEGEGTLEAALQAREREGGSGAGSQAREEAFDPSQLAASMRSFIEKGTGPAQGGAPSSGAFEVGGFLKELKKALGGVEQASSEEGSSFWEGSQSDQEGVRSGRDEKAAPWPESGASACTATDSDDEGNERKAFAEAYDQHLGQELEGTAARGLATFDVAKGPAADPGPMPGWEGSAGATSTPQGRDAALEEALEPVRLDEHVVRNLLASYAGQEGMAGPVQSIAGLLGVALPDSRGLRDVD